LPRKALYVEGIEIEFTRRLGVNSQADMRATQMAFRAQSQAADG